MARTVDFMSGYLRRIVDTELDELFCDLAAIWLDGPVGPFRRPQSERSTQS